MATDTTSAGGGRRWSAAGSSRWWAAWWAAWWPAVAVYAAILAVGAVPGDALAGTPSWWAVPGHLASYAVLAAAVRHGLGGRGTALGAVVGTVALGVVNEVQQGLVPGRAPDVADVGVDGLGALAAVVLLALRDRSPLVPRRGR